MSAYVMITGNMTADPVIRQANGTKVASFSVGSRTNKKTSDGSYQSDFYDVSVWGVAADYVVAHAKKGTGCVVRGTLTKETYKARSGEERLSLRVHADGVELTERKKDGAAPAAASTATRSRTTASAPADDIDEFAELGL